MSSSELPQGYSNMFLQVFQDVVESKNLHVKEWLENGAVLEDDDGHELQTFFTNVYRRCQDLPPDDWPDVIEHFMSQVFVEEKPPENLADVADQLRARLGMPFTVEPNGVQPWSRQLGESGLVVNLVVDYPGRMLYVTQEMIRTSDKPADHWLAVALQHLQADTPDEWFSQLDDDTGIRVACIGDSYDAARALILDQLLPDTADKGCLVAPMGRDVVFFLPVTEELVQNVHLLKVLTEKNYATTPYPISEDVFWVRGDEWQHFPIEIGADSIEVFPPVEMLKLLGWVDEDDPTN